ncbi:hypothetical protein [Risungbinella massiliensis]|uniref:hypothetical protein n=1 Tax=Risungbinella massiliensis TaxID=1329796 RepID=UPI0005CB8C50|nr:hypothetical protein [Risungbinella massiliensis]
MVDVRSWSWWREEKLLIWIGALGICLGILTGILYFIIGNEIPPNGELKKPLTFLLAFGFFTWTTAAFLPFTKWSDKQRIFFRWSMTVYILYSYLTELGLTLFGYDPRFASGNNYASTMGLIFGFISVFMIVNYLWLFIHFLRPSTKGKYPYVVVAIRYALLISLIGFSSGIWMGVLSGRYSQEANLMVLHFLGFHGFQAIPIIGALLTLSKQMKTSLLHLGGISWFMATICMVIKSVLGESLFHLDLFLIGAIGFLGIWVYAMLRSFILWKRSNHNNISAKDRKVEF